MSQLDDLHARMANITRLLKSEGAGKATQVIQETLAAAGLTAGTTAGADRPGAATTGNPQAFVSSLLARFGVAPERTSTQEKESETGSAEFPPGRFVSGAYSNAAGTRRYKIYIPNSHTSDPMPLIVMLHGCTQDPDDFARGTQMNQLAEENGFLVLYPQQDAASNSSKCWNWFNAMDQKQGQGEPSLIAGITNEVIEQYGADRRKVFVAGLSAGGAMAVIMGTTYPDLYSAVGVHSGLPYASATDLPSALSAMKGNVRRSDSSRHASRRSVESIPIIVFHGDRDVTVNATNGKVMMDDFVAGFEQGNAPSDKISTVVEDGEVAGGHRFSRTSLHADGRPVLAEHWLIHGAGHAWAGGSARGSYTDPKGPDASKEMLRFFNTQTADA